MIAARPECAPYLDWQAEQTVPEDQFLEGGQEDDDLEAEECEGAVPAGVALDELDVRLVGEFDAEPLGDGLGKIAKADGRSCDHRPGLES